MSKPIDIIKSDIQLNSMYYLELMKLCLKLNEHNNEYDSQKYDANGYSAFVMGNLVLDTTVFVYEAIKFLKMYDNPTYKRFIANGIKKEMLDDIKKVRNNMHLFNKSGSYIKKASTIIESQLEEFDMLEQDLFYSLRTDICEIIYEDCGNEYFIGTNYFYFHAVYETSGMKGVQIKNFSATVSSLVNRLTSCYRNNIQIDSPKEKNLECNIFFRDVKSSEIIEQNGFSQATNFRLLLSLTQAGWAYTFLFKILDIDIQDKKALWFFTKYLAIKYDEIIDNLENLLQYAKEKNHLKLMLNQNCLDLDALTCTTIASSLRNTLHYNIQDVRKNQNLYYSFLLNNNISQNEFSGVFEKMKMDLQLVISTLQSVLAK